MPRTTNKRNAYRMKRAKYAKRKNQSQHHARTRCPGMVLNAHFEAKRDECVMESYRETVDVARFVRSTNGDYVRMKQFTIYSLCSCSARMFIQHLF